MVFDPRLYATELVESTIQAIINCGGGWKLLISLSITKHHILYYVLCVFLFVIALSQTVFGFLRTRYEQTDCIYFSL